MPLSQVQTGSPDFFTYEESELLAGLPWFGPWLTLHALDLPTTPQQTAPFCAVRPPDDLPTEQDYLLLATPLLALAAGTYRRLGNYIKAMKWAELCEFTPGTIQGTSSDPPDGFHMWYTDVEIVNGPTGDNDVKASLGPLPAGIVQVAWQLLDEPLAFDISTTAFSTFALDVGASKYDPPNLDNYTPVTTVEAQDWSIGWVPISTVYNDVWVSQTNGWVGLNGALGHYNVAISWGVEEPYELPDAPVPPSGYPTADPCDAATLADLCKALKSLSDKVDYLIKNTRPPALEPDPQPTDVEPDPLAPTTTTPVAKPPLAYGVIIQLANIPNHQPGYGATPKFWPSLGHYAFSTPSGPLASELIKHNPLVVLGIPPQAQAITLDLAPDVTGKVTWLYPPK